MSWPMPSQGYESTIRRTMLTSVQFILFVWKAVRIPPLKSGHPSSLNPSIPPLIRGQIEKVHNSVMGHFGVEYTRKALLSRGVIDQGLRRFVEKFVRAQCAS